MKNDSNLYLIFLVFIFMLLTWLNLQDFVLPLFENISTLNIFGILYYFTSLLQPIGFVTLVYLGLLIGYEIEVHIAKDTLEEILAPLIIK